MNGLLREALVSSVSDRAPFVAILLTCLLCTGVALATTGQTAAAEKAVTEQIDRRSSRVVVIRDQSLDQLSLTHVELLGALSAVDWVLGFGPAQEGVNAHLAGTDPVPVRRWIGRPPAPQRTAWDVSAGAGIVAEEAQTKLRLSSPFGAIVAGQRTSIPLVGPLIAPADLALLEGSVLVRSGEDDPVTLRSIHIGATSPSAAVKVAGLVPQIVQPPNPDQLSVETSEALVQLRRAVAGQLGRHGRNILFQVVGAASLLIFISLYAKVTVGRRELGRRRALGATRSTIVLLVMLQGLIPAAAGALLASGTFAVAGALGRFPPVPASFQLAVVGLVASTSVVAGLYPAAVAAWRDPVTVLRQP